MPPLTIVFVVGLIALTFTLCAPQSFHILPPLRYWLDRQYKKPQQDAPNKNVKTTLLKPAGQSFPKKKDAKTVTISNVKVTTAAGNSTKTKNKVVFFSDMLLRRHDDQKATTTTKLPHVDYIIGTARGGSLPTAAAANVTSNLWRTWWRGLREKVSDVGDYVMWNDGGTKIWHLRIKKGETSNFRRFRGAQYLNIVVQGSDLDVYNSNDEKIHTFTPSTGDVYRLSKRGEFIVGETSHHKLVLPTVFKATNVGSRDYIEYVIEHQRQTKPDPAS